MQRRNRKLSPLVGRHQKLHRRIEEVPYKTVVPPCVPLCAVLSGREGKHTPPAQKCSVEVVFRVSEVSGIVSVRENTKDESHSRIKAVVAGGPCGKYLCPRCGQLRGLLRCPEMGSKKKGRYRFCGHYLRELTPARKKRGACSENNTI